MGKSELSKRIDENRPIEIWSTPDGSWTWEVYKKYQKPDKESKNPHARWFCRVKTQFVPQGELGDVYVSDIKSHARMVFKEKEVAKKKLRKVM